MGICQSRPEKENQGRGVGGWKVRRRRRIGEVGGLGGVGGVGGVGGDGGGEVDNGSSSTFRTETS